MCPVKINLQKELVPGEKIRIVGENCSVGGIISHLGRARLAELLSPPEHFPARSDVCTQGNEWAEKISLLGIKPTVFVDGSCAAISQQVFPKEKSKVETTAEIPLCFVQCQLLGVDF